MTKRMTGLGAALSIIVLASVSTSGMAGSMYGQSLEAGVPFVVGGIGTDARTEMNQLSPRYRLRVTNSTRAGELITDVRVRLRDANGRIVLDTVANGPILLADPLPGAYSLESEFEGQNQTRKLTISNSGQTEVLSNWQAS